ncbi:hypothetical protein R5R35_008017 [Gryllus longicercus]|uniref:Serine/threonine-protein kinase PLK4 n=1 Tax=Gryllus longicercus TaxID=2509291 RepID=A0AAN9VE86_9ORTH
MPPFSGGRTGFGERIENYEVHNLLGKGGFASVYRAKCLKSGTDVAVKMIDKKLMQAAGMVERVRQEVAIHCRLKHPSVLELYTFFEDANYVYLILELCHNGEIQRYLKNNSKILDEQEASHILRQVVQGLLYLHSHNILHRDLSLSNLLLTRDMQVKIADFGLATQLTRPDEKHHTMCGTPNYISPEVATRSSHGLEADVWGLGCLLYTLLVGRPPFDTDAVKSTLTRVVMANYKLPAYLSLEAKDLIDSLLKKNPKERIRLCNILDHPFMKHSKVQKELKNEESLGGDSGRGTISTNTPSQKTSSHLSTNSGSRALWPRLFEPLPEESVVHSPRESLSSNRHCRSRSEERFGNFCSSKFKQASSLSNEDGRISVFSQNGISCSATPCSSSSYLLHKSEQGSPCISYDRKTPCSAGHFSHDEKKATGCDDKCSSNSSSCCKKGSEVCLSRSPTVESLSRFDSAPEASSAAAPLRTCSSHCSFSSPHGSRCAVGKCPSGYHKPSLSQQDDDCSCTHKGVFSKCSNCSNCQCKQCERSPIVVDYSQETKSKQQYGDQKFSGERVLNDCFDKYSGPEKMKEHTGSLDKCHLSQGSSGSYQKGAGNDHNSHCSHYRADVDKHCNRTTCSHSACSCCLLHDLPGWKESVALGKKISSETRAVTERLSNEQCFLPSGKNLASFESPGSCPRESRSTECRRQDNPPQSSTPSVQKAPISSPLSSIRLQPTRHSTKNAILSIVADGEVVIEFLKKKSSGSEERVVDVCRISNDGMRIVLYQPNGGKGCLVRNSPPELPVQGADAIYSFETLPAKHWKKYLYASRFVDLVKAKTPKVTFYSEKAKCMLMENSPDPDIEMCFYEGGKIIKSSTEGIKLTDISGRVTDLSSPHKLESLAPSSRLMWEHYQQCAEHCMLLEKTLSQVFGDSPSTANCCFPVIVGRRPSTSTSTALQDKENVHADSKPMLQSFSFLTPNSAPPSRGISPAPSVGRLKNSVHIPGIGIAAQLPNGEVQVCYADGSVLIMNARGGEIRYSEKGGQPTHYLETDPVPSSLRERLGKVPLIMRYLIQRVGSSEGASLKTRVRNVR